MKENTVLFGKRVNLQGSSVPTCLISNVLFAEGGLGYHWDACLKGYNQDNKVWT